MDMIIIGLFLLSAVCFVYAGYLFNKQNKRYTKVNGMVFKWRVYNINNDFNNKSGDEVREEILNKIIKGE